MSLQENRRSLVNQWLFIKCLKCSSVTGDPRETQNLALAFKELLAVLGGNPSDTLAGIIVVHNFYELPLRYCRSLEKDSINGKKPSFFGLFHLSLETIISEIVHANSFDTGKAGWIWRTVVMSITLWFGVICSLFRPACAMLLLLYYVIHR